MPDSKADVAAAKRAIRDMLNEAQRPTQKRISAATGLTQGYVAKINRCEFASLNPGIRKVVEYSLMTPAGRLEVEAAASGLTERIRTGAGRLIARDPELGGAVAEFIERLTKMSRPE